jgi:hypothetical protein
MLERACQEVAAYLGFEACCGSCGANVSFFTCPVPVQVLTDTQTYRETVRNETQTCRETYRGNGGIGFAGTFLTRNS